MMILQRIAMTKQFTYVFMDTSFNPAREHVVEVTAENVTIAFADAKLDGAYILYEVKPAEASDAE